MSTSSLKIENQLHPPLQLFQCTRHQLTEAPFSCLNRNHHVVFVCFVFLNNSNEVNRIQLDRFEAFTQFRWQRWSSWNRRAVERHKPWPCWISVPFLLFRRIAGGRCAAMTVALAREFHRWMSHFLGLLPLVFPFERFGTAPHRLDPININNNSNNTNNQNFKRWVKHRLTRPRSAAAIKNKTSTSTWTPTSTWTWTGNSGNDKEDDFEDVYHLRPPSSGRLSPGCFHWPSTRNWKVGSKKKNHFLNNQTNQKKINK